MRILLGMSGGLDSSYAALKLKEEGHSVEGAVLIMHDFTETESAREAAREVGIKLHEIDCRALFEEKVASNFISEYTRGRTPNPCIVCNREVKFRVLLDYAKANGFDKIATGHYARIENSGNDGKAVICRSHDEKKDQSYMLWRLSRDVIDNLVFPLSDCTKEEIRAKAEALALSSAKKRDSQEICFIPSGDYGEYIEERVGKSIPGDFIDADGKVLGKHNGILHYTIGQRKGLGIALGARAFITDIDPETNQITLSFSADERLEFTVSDVIFSGIEPKYEGEISDFYVKVRYQAAPVFARVEFLSGRRAKVSLSLPARSVTAGQSAVFYLGDTLAFGGFIE